MCGIVGYIGDKNAQEILLEGLGRLEYRGYDSSGLAAISNGELHLAKRQGKLKDLRNIVAHTPLEGEIGIGHTRWATHGAPNETNAHPHTDCEKKIAIVHNGIIENFAQLKSGLKKKGHIFRSDTDTEVIAHLIEELYIGSLERAVLMASRLLEGAFAIAIIHKDEPDKIIAVRNQSPLIVGLGTGENFIASDVPAVLKRTKNVIYLKNGQIAVVTRDSVVVKDFSGKKKTARPERIKWSAQSAEKEGFAHFMLKEIHEQPAVISSLIRTAKPEIERAARLMKGVKDISIVACGTAYHAGLFGKYVIEALSSFPVSVDMSSEFRYRNPIIDKKTLVIAISQSGETADTLAAVEEAKRKGARVLSVCNVIGSSITRESDMVINTCAGPEIGVASTKAYTAQLAVLFMIALHIAKITKKTPKKRIDALYNMLKKVPSLQKRIIEKQSTHIKALGERHHHFGSFLFLGRHINYPTALEGALKLKEISYIPAEGYAAGEMKHGPIALIDEYRAVVCIAPESKVYEKMLSNIQEILSRKGKIVIIATENSKGIAKEVKDIVYISRTDELLSPLLVAPVLQLLAYYIAVERKCDVDQPRNLAKSVTVE